MKNPILACLLLAYAITGLGSNSASAPATGGAGSTQNALPGKLLARDQLMPFEVAWDQGGKKRGPEVRAQIVQSSGFRHYPMVQYQHGSLAEVDATLTAMRQRGVAVSAVLIGSDKPGEDPKITALFDALKRHQVNPQIWVTQSYSYFPTSEEGWRQRFADGGFSWPAGVNNGWAAMQLAFSSNSTLTAEQKQRFFKAWHHIFTDTEHFPRTPEEQQQRVVAEAARVKSLAQLASRYGFRVSLYNHNGWFGVMDNQLAIIERLKGEGICDVGIVYTFWHARDELHDDVKGFEDVWARIKPHVTAIGVSGVGGEWESLYPSQGPDELGMLRVIEESGWRGPVALLCFDFGVDPAAVMRNVRQGVDWLSAELERQGSGGHRPFGLWVEPGGSTTDR